MSKTAPPSFHQLLELTEKDLQPVVNRLKALILEVDPNTCEVVRLGERAATFGVGPKKMSEGYAFILPHKNWVNLGFYQGAALDNQNALLEGSGKNMRHIKIRSLADAEQPGLKQLLTQAIAERRRALGMPHSKE
jgi:hypothetical protein